MKSFDREQARRDVWRLHLYRSAAITVLVALAVLAAGGQWRTWHLAAVVCLWAVFLPWPPSVRRKCRWLEIAHREGEERRARVVKARPVLRTITWLIVVEVPPGQGDRPNRLYCYGAPWRLRGVKKGDEIDVLFARPWWGKRGRAACLPYWRAAETEGDSGGQGCEAV